MRHSPLSTHAKSQSPMTKPPHRFQKHEQSPPERRGPTKQKRRRTHLIPHHDGALLPPDPAAEVERADVVVQEAQHGGALLRLGADDVARHGRVDEQRGRARDRVADDERVLGGHGLAQGALVPDARHLAGAGAGVPQPQRVQRRAVGGRQRRVRGRQRREGRVAAARAGRLERPEERRGRRVGREGLVDVPEVVAGAAAEEGSEVASGRGEGRSSVTAFASLDGAAGRLYAEAVDFAFSVSVRGGETAGELLTHTFSSAYTTWNSGPVPSGYPIVGCLCSGP